MNKQNRKRPQIPTKLFRVQKDIGDSFSATSELIGMNENELIEKLMNVYVDSIKAEIIDVASQFPEFDNKYPFILNHEKRNEVNSNS